MEVRVQDEKALVMQEFKWQVVQTDGCLDVDGEVIAPRCVLRVWRFLSPGHCHRAACTSDGQWPGQCQAVFAIRLPGLALVFVGVCSRPRSVNGRR